MSLAQWMSEFSERKLNKNCYHQQEFENARQQLLANSGLTEKEKILLKNVSLLVHRHDDMFMKNEIHYLMVGLESIRCIDHALHKSSANKDIRSILDFPCGYGRELRFLKCRFPDTDISGSEIIPEALDFGKKVFSIKTFISTANFADLRVPEKFDLIWCGSLITHKNETAITNLLKFFHDHLLPDGLCLFTAQGRTSVELIKRKTNTYNLPESKLDKLMAQFNETGFGYVDYDGLVDYGVSLISHDYMTTLAQKAGDWKESFFAEHGWDNHQDVHAYKKPAL
jgi:SAM-dependent methyltransferase